MSANPAIIPENFFTTKIEEWDRPSDFLNRYPEETYAHHSPISLKLNKGKSHVLADLVRRYTLRRTTIFYPWSPDQDKD